MPSTDPLKLLWLGVRESLRWRRVVRFLSASQTIKKKVLQCFVLNGLILLGLVFFLHHIIFPYFSWIASPLFSESLAETLFSASVNLLWVYPLYSASLFINSMWYKDIAVHALNLVPHHSKLFKTSQKGIKTTILSMLSNEVIRLLVEVSLFFEVFLVWMVPIVGNVLVIFLLNMIYSFYCFEYKWALLNVPLDKRIRHFEKYWLYFFGFGLWSSIATFFFPFIISSGLYSFIFPWLIIMGIDSSEADLHKIVKDEASNLPPLRIFLIPQLIVNTLLKRFQ